MSYKFKFKRRLLTTTRVVDGHRYEQPQDKMVLFFPDGSVEEIAQWSKCSARLGPDWKIAQQKAMEAQAGQAIPVK